MSTINCTSCGHPNDASHKLCALCSQPLQMTMLAAQAPAAVRLPTLLAIGSGSPTPLANMPTRLVPVDPTSQDEQPGRSLVFPTKPEFSVLMGWQDFGSGNFPQYDLAKLYPEWLVTANPQNGQPLCQVSRKTGTLRSDDIGNVFISCDIDASSLMWVQEPGELPRRLLPSDESVLMIGMFVFLGKNNAGVTFVVR